MTKPAFSRTFGASALAILALAASCTLPTISTAPGHQAPAALGANQARLVFQPNPGKALLSDAGYLTVELRSAEGTVKSGDAPKEADGSYLVTITGLIAGDWNIKVRLYADALSPALLFYADLPHQFISAGVPTPLNIKVYQPGSVAAGTLGLADTVTYVEVDRGGLPWGDSKTSPNPVQRLFPGENVQLHAVPVTVLPDLSTVPATDQGVTWSSDDPSVAEFSAGGKLTARFLGETVIRVTTNEGRRVAVIPVKVEDSLVGVWESTPIYEGTPVRRSLIRIDRGLAGLTVHHLKNLSPLGLGGQVPEHWTGFALASSQGHYNATLNSKYLLTDPSHWILQPATLSLLSITQTGIDEFEVASTMMAAVLPTEIYHRVANYVPVTTITRDGASTPLNVMITDTAASLASSVTINNLAPAPTVDNLFWWSEVPGNVNVNSWSGILTLFNPSSVIIHAVSLDNPSVTLSWQVNVSVPAPSLSVSDLTVAYPIGYDPLVPQLNLIVHIPASVLPGSFVLIQKWDGAAWADINAGTGPVNPNDTFGNSIGGMAPASETKFRVITKGNPAAFTVDSAPSPAISGYTTGTDGFPALFTMPNQIPTPPLPPEAGGNPDWWFFHHDFGAGEIVQGINSAPDGYYFSRFYSDTAGTPAAGAQFLGYGDRKWWLFSVPDPAFPAQTVKTVAVEVDQMGGMFTTLDLPGLSKVWQVVNTAGIVGLTGFGGSTGTLYWNPISFKFQLAP